MTVETIRVSRGWLDLREPADAAARSWELVGELRRSAPAGGAWSIHDLACGSGAMGRWLAPLLPGPQRWVLHDRDADLLEVAAVDAPVCAADGAEVSVETRLADVTELHADDLAGATLVTASALLDLLTLDELTALIDACAGAGCPALLALSVTGRVQLLPADPLDARVAAAFDAHQRRETARGCLLGPDAVEAAAEGFRRRGFEVLVRPSPWRLGAAECGLVAEWLTGWVDAACEQEPSLVPDADLYRRRRLREAAAGALAVVVAHAAAGEFLGWAVSLRAYGIALASALVLYPVRQLIVQTLILRQPFSLRGGALDHLVARERNVGISAVEAVSYVSAAVLLAGIL